MTKINYTTIDAHKRNLTCNAFTLKRITKLLECFKWAQRYGLSIAFHAFEPHFIGAVTDNNSRKTEQFNNLNELEDVIGAWEFRDG